MINLKFLIFCDVGESCQINIQEPATETAQQIQYFHDTLMFNLILIGFFVLIILFFLSKTINKKISKFSHSAELEIIWSILPCFCLIFIAIPSLTLAYHIDNIPSKGATVILKIIGHQWYWTYEYDNMLNFNNIFPNTNKFIESQKGFSFDSYIINTEDLTVGSFRLLEVDNRVILPENTNIKLLITSSDVLHSWAVPSFGIKVDACPGRLSEISFIPKRVGVYFGQCSEICGVNHGFMPIVVQIVSLDQYIQFLGKKINIRI